MEAVEEVAEIVGDQESDQGYVGLYGYKGCLISDVSWYSSGTCATFHLSSSSGKSMWRG